MTHRVSAREVSERRDRYYMDQQVGAYSIVLSIALGVAGLAAASLFYVTPEDRSYRVSFWALWLTSLVAVAIVYSGMNVNAFALPGRVPDLMDIFSPFAMALLEFALFAVLTRPLTSQIPPRSVVVIWFGTFGIFCCLASLVITRVRWLFQHTRYERALKEPVDRVVRKLGEDRRGAALSALVAISMAVIFEFIPTVPPYVTYIVAATIVAGFVSGFLSHKEQRKALESGLAMAGATRVGGSKYQCRGRSGPPAVRSRW